MKTWLVIFQAAVLRARYENLDKTQMRELIDHMFYVVLDKNADDRMYWLYEYGLKQNIQGL
jgi:hypothetical protein